MPKRSTNFTGKKPIKGSHVLSLMEWVGMSEAEIKAALEKQRDEAERAALYAIDEPTQAQEGDPMNKHIASYLNRTGDVEVIVTLLESGSYAVRIYDVDAEATLPASRHYKNEDAARAYAIKCATWGETEELPL